MSRTAKILIILSSTMVTLLAGGWGFVYASSSRLMETSPGSNAHLANVRPDIVAEWPAKTGVTLRSARVALDGVDISRQVKLGRTGFAVKPAKDLSQGDHVVEATLEYSVFMVPKTVAMKWTFEVDTVAPPLQANDGRTIFATNDDYDSVKGYSDPESTVTALYRDSEVEVRQEDNGVFQVLVEGIPKKPKKTLLQLQAKDPAGNVTVRNVWVVRDEGPPKITWSSPEPGEVIHDKSYSFKAGVVERDSYLASARVYIDGRLVGAVVKRGILSTPSLPSNKDGRHVARIEVTDAVGNTVRETIKFKTDSRYIVVSRSQRRLWLYRNGKVWRSYRVAVGQPGFPTPLGNWEIVLKRYRPTWVNPNEEWSADMPARIGPGPGNPLGTRALNLSAPGIRIHGTYASGSIGRAASHGCIRMLLRDVEELYELVDVGTPVKIIE